MNYTIVAQEIKNSHISNPCVLLLADGQLDYRAEIELCSAPAGSTMLVDSGSFHHTIDRDETVEEIASTLEWLHGQIHMTAE